MTLYNRILSITAVCILSSCGAKYAKTTIEDARPADKYVYGEIDGPPKQLKNTYPDAKPETIQKAQAFRSEIEKQLMGY